MTRRTKIVIGIVIALILLALALYFLWQRPGGVDTIDVTPTGDAAQGGLLGREEPNRESTATPPVFVAPSETVTPGPVDEESSLRRLASAFAERFGSFSNETDFVNLTDLKAVMTVSMQRWTDEFIADAKAEGTDTTLYSGTTTRSLNATITAFDASAGTATVRVSTQRRQESSDSAEAEVYYQDIIIDFIKTNGEWKADSAEWQPRQ